MRKIVKTQGICLVSHPWHETSKIVTFFTEKFGKITFVAKGARRPKSKFGSCLEIFTLSELIFNRTEIKPIYTLVDTNLINNFQNLQSPTKFFFANEIVKLILNSVPYEDPNPKLFSLILSALKILNQSANKRTANYNSLLNGYYLKAISILGYKPQFKNCVLCKNPKVAYFSIRCGGVICLNHSKPDDAIEIQQIKIIKYLLNIPLVKTLEFTITKLTQKIIQDYIAYYLHK
ncbi:MAG: DNA repair protein RecO [candidate division WOR-3 bacterium]